MDDMMFDNFGLSEDTGDSFVVSDIDSDVSQFTSVDFNSYDDNYALNNPGGSDFDFTSETTTYAGDEDSDHVYTVDELEEHGIKVSTAKSGDCRSECRYTTGYAARSHEWGWAQG